MVTMPAAPKADVWALILVRVPRERVIACSQALSVIAEPQQYVGGGWYIKRIELLEPAQGPKDPYRLSLAVKARDQQAMNDAVAQIAGVLANASLNTASYDIYPVSGIIYAANW